MAEPHSPLGLTGRLAHAACLLEATAPKAGNVHPGESFADTTYEDFVLSAASVAPILDHAPGAPLGHTILDAVKATRARVGKNTNLGIILLLAPLCSLPPEMLAGAATTAGGRALAAALRRLLQLTTRRDAELVYEAIRLASPGGLGTASEGDVRAAPTGTLLEVMTLARERDLVARQYADGFREVIEEASPSLQRSAEEGLTPEHAVVRCHLALLASHGDSLIARKRGDAESREAARRARGVLALGWPGGAGAAEAFADLDAWLREDGNARNPGSCADLTTAGVLLAMATGAIPAGAGWP